MTAATRDALVEWLLDGDPAVRWQTLRDLVGAPAEAVARERRRVGVEGWGARLLAVQDRDGRWGGGLYSPKWTSTTYTLLLLHWLGLPSEHPQAKLGCTQLWEGARFFGGGLDLTKHARRPETCVTGLVVLLSSTFDHLGDHLDQTVAWLLREQLADGGWNCESIRCGSRHGSFHTSIIVLEALAAYERGGGRVDVGDAIGAGRDFFLVHSLYRSHRTGQIVSERFKRFPFPPQWHFDVLRGLEFFRASHAPADERLADAIAVVRRARRADGTWHGHRPYPGRQWFEIEPTGRSRWATLRCLRVLDWWDRGTQRSPSGSRGVRPCPESATPTRAPR